MKCPSCNNKLVRTQYAGRNVRRCMNCHGMLMPKQRAESIQKRIDKDQEALRAEIDSAEFLDLTARIRCPDCRDKMSRRLIKKLGFHVDECDTCDMAWFDAGELAQLQLEYDSKPRTKELNAMRERLENMTDRERWEYEKRIAALPDLGSQFQQILSATVNDMADRYYLHSRHSQ